MVPEEANATTVDTITDGQESQDARQEVRVDGRCESRTHQSRLPLPSSPQLIFFSLLILLLLPPSRHGLPTRGQQGHGSAGTPWLAWR